MNKEVDYDVEDFKSRYQIRLERVKDDARKVFSFEDVEAPPFIVNSSFYCSFGTDPEAIPDGYYDDPAIMTQFQERSHYQQIKAVDDSFLPYLVPWFGTCVLSSAMGAKVEYLDKKDPTFDPRQFALNDENDVRNLKITNPDTDGLMPKVLKFIRHMKENSFLPVGITDCQGPLATANQILGYDKLVFMMLDSPEVVHELMDKITTSLINWIKRQKEEIGENLNECIGNQQIYVGENAGVWFSDDDLVLWDPETYESFVVPYNSRICKEFGGGIVHYCGNGNHQIDNLLNTEGLVGVNNYGLHDLDGVHELKNRLAKKLVLFACDYAPMDHEKYYNELFSDISLDGLVVDCQFSPVEALVESGYSNTRRDMRSTQKELVKSIQNALKGR